jgi:hypothetical protein
VGFLLFAVAIAVANQGPKVLGIVGITLFAVTVSGLVILGVGTKGPPPPPPSEENNTAVDHDEKKEQDIGLVKIVIMLLTFTIQLICLILLLGFGIPAIATGKLGKECDGVQDQVYNGGNPMPVSVVNEAANGVVTVSVTRDYTATVTTTTTSLGTVTEKMSDMMSGVGSTTSGDDGVATVVTWTSIWVTATVTAS